MYAITKFKTKQIGTKNRCELIQFKRSLYTNTLPSKQASALNVFVYSEIPLETVCFRTNSCTADALQNVLLHINRWHIEIHRLCNFDGNKKVFELSENMCKTSKAWVFFSSRKQSFCASDCNEFLIERVDIL